METVGELFNAVAFAGAGFLFSKLNHTGYEKEIKRHNEAMEKLSRDKETWYENQIKRKEEIQRLRQQLSDANADINQTNKSLKILAEIQNEYTEEEENEPKLENYYTPSEEMKEYKIVIFFAGGLTGGYLGYKVYNRFFGIKKIEDFTFM